MIQLSVPTYMAIIAGIIAIIFVIGAIWRWPSEHAKWWRVILFVLGLLGLWISYVQPLQTIHSPGINAIISQDTSGMIHDQSVPFPDIYSLINAKIYDQVDTVILTDVGYSPEDLELLQDKQVRYQPKKWYAGITNLHIPTIYAEKEWEFTGSVKDISSISITTPDGNAVDGKLSDNQFIIASRAPVAGDYLYDVTITTTAGDTTREKLPVRVLPSTPWKMLMLASNPNFDINYFKNYWANQGHGLALQIQLSRDNFQSTYINTDRFPIQPLTRKKLEQFHFIHIDIPAWNGLGNYSRNLILQAIKENGLALILVPGHSGDQPIGLPSSMHVAEKQDIIFSSPLEEVSLPTLQLSGNSQWQSIYFQNQLIGKHYQWGWGNMAFPAISQSYRLILADQEVMYHNLWATFYSAIFVRPGQDIQFHLPQMIFENQKTELQIISGSEDIFPLQWNDSLSLSVVASPLLDGIHHAHFWPSSGWNKLTTRDKDESRYFYVHPTSTWQAYQQELLSNTIGLISNPEKTMVSDKAMEPWPWYIGWVIALLGFGGLWLLERMG